MHNCKDSPVTQEPNEGGALIIEMAPLTCEICLTSN